ncbi:MAG: Glyoxalase-like domain [Candidatus Parcubacteria bacterium]|jgi:predicted enzyme related to lactoylglutathione lyase
MLKVSSILIGVNDLNKAKPFYEQVFGFQFNEFRPPFASANLDGVEFNIEEYADYRPKDWAENYIGGRKQISFETDNLEKFLTKAESLGAKIIETPQEKPWGWKEAVIADSDNNEFIVEQKL